MAVYNNPISIFYINNPPKQIIRFAIMMDPEILYKKIELFEDFSVYAYTIVHNLKLLYDEYRNDDILENN